MHFNLKIGCKNLEKNLFLHIGKFYESDYFNIRIRG